MFDFAQLAIGGIALVWLIPRVVQFLKTALGLSGTRNIWIVVFALGLFFSGLAAAINQFVCRGRGNCRCRVGYGREVCREGNAGEQASLGDAQFRFEQHRQPDDGENAFDVDRPALSYHVEIAQ